MVKTDLTKLEWTSWLVTYLKINVRIFYYVCDMWKNLEKLFYNSGKCKWNCKTYFRNKNNNIFHFLTYTYSSDGSLQTIKTFFTNKTKHICRSKYKCWMTHFDTNKKQSRTACVNFIHLNFRTLMVKTIVFVITDCITTFEV